MDHIVIVGWERFQHYKDRDPPWVKLYRDLLTSESWVLGTDISRLVQVASILLAARYANKIPLQWTLIRKVSSLECTEKQFREALQHLEATQFIQIQRDSESASTALATCTTTSEVLYSEAIQSRAETEQRQSRAEDVGQEPDGPVNRIFAHWRTLYRKPKASLDPKRRKAIERALKEYDEATLCQAIAGYQNSPHHMGQNERHTVYDDIELMLRDAKHVEAGLGFNANGAAPKLSSLTRRNVDATADWMPPEMRNAAS